MNNVLKIFILTMLTVSVSACQNVPAWKYSMFERPAGNYNYPPLYIKGWKDGCESGAQASANHLYRIRYKFKQDWQLITNPVYRNGWDSAYNQCRKYILQQNMNQQHEVQTASTEESDDTWAW